MKLTKQYGPLENKMHTLEVDIESASAYDRVHAGTPVGLPRKIHRAMML